MRRSRLLLVAFAAAGAACFIARERGLPLARFTVEGVSMTPAYHDGDRVLVRRWRRDALRAGDVVVLADPEQPGHHILKRVAFDARRGDAIYVLGDNAAASRDSRHFGEVPRGQIVGRVVMRY